MLSRILDVADIGRVKSEDLGWKRVFVDIITIDNLFEGASRSEEDLSRAYTEDWCLVFLI